MESSALRFAARAVSVALAIAVGAAACGEEEGGPCSGANPEEGRCEDGCIRLTYLDESANCEPRSRVVPCSGGEICPAIPLPPPVLCDDQRIYSAPTGCPNIEGACEHDENFVARNAVCFDGPRDANGGAGGALP